MGRRVPYTVSPCILSCSKSSLKADFAFTIIQIKKLRSRKALFPMHTAPAVNNSGRRGTMSENRACDSEIETLAPHWY